MMKQTIHIISVLLCSAAILGCSSEIMTYEGESGIYFAMKRIDNSVNSDTTYNDSSLLPFIVTESADSTFLLKVKIMGPVSHLDRKFIVRLDEQESTVREEDYSPLEPSYTMKAGEIFGVIPITFHRTASLGGQERRMVLELIANEDFALPITLWKNSSTEYVNVTRHTVTVSDKYIQLPGYREPYFGPFSEKKMKLLLEISGMKLSDFNEPFSYTKAKALGQQLDRYLKEQKALGNTIYEDDGTEMRAGDFIYI